ncbi:MAG TPA: TIGR04282 family arsenosugar biosynthesis glycosyltransferase [Blastocatellia bacterium]|jgi:hypothetical protein
MAKAPRPGHVKTRLVPPLTQEEAAELSLCFLRDTATNVADVAAREVADCVAVYTPVGSEHAFEGVLPDCFGLLAQCGDSLGERLFHATQDLLELGYESVCLINSDSPTLPGDRLTSALAAMSLPGDRVVLGPAEDGGYYLIGLKEAHRHLFIDIDWSTARVLSQTIDRASEIDLEVYQLPSWYDLDDVETLYRLCDELFRGNGERGRNRYTAAHTRDYLARLLERDDGKRIWPGGSA